MGVDGHPFPRPSTPSRPRALAAAGGKESPDSPPARAPSPALANRLVSGYHGVGDDMGGYHTSMARAHTLPAPARGSWRPASCLPQRQRHYLYDGLGSTRQLLDASQNVTDTYSYEAFGHLKGTTGRITVHSGRCEAHGTSRQLRSISRLRGGTECGTYAAGYDKEEPRHACLD